MDYIVARLSEPSTYAGIAAIIIGILHLTGPAAASVTQMAAGAGVVVAGAIAVVVAERGSKTLAPGAPK